MRFEQYSRKMLVAVKCIAYVTTGFVFGAMVSMADENLTGSQMEMIIVLVIFVAVINSIVAAFIIIPMSRLSAGKVTSVIREKTSILKENEKCLQKNIKLLQDKYYAKERASKAKTKFLGRMSHDLRTPMNAIMGYSTLLEQACDEPEKVSHYAKKIQLSGQSLMEMINDVLDMNLIENGNVRLVDIEFSMETAIEEVRLAIKPQIEARKQKFNFYMTNSSNRERIVADKKRFCQILRNLLSNASKYTPDEGTIDMMVNVIETGEDRLQFLCQIKDTGRGMSEEFLGRLFQPYEREANSQNDNVQGTGLGMSIAKSFVDLMDGEITVESKPEAGTLVTVQLPLTPAAAEEQPVMQMFHNQEILRGMRFLAAEDNEFNAEILQEVLSAMGAECVVTENGHAVIEAFEASGEDEFDMILMDIQMPVMDGYQATAALRKCRHPRAKDIVVLAMTADAFEEDVQRAFVSGMNGHVAKPLDLQAFINTVDVLKKR